MNTLLWICQILLALTFLFSGVSKSTVPVTRSVAKGQTGVEGLPTSLVRFIGVCELLGVVALVVPWHFGIVPILTPAAALGLGIIMVLAARVHFRGSELKTVAANLALFTLCLVVAVGRLRDLL
jgi:DoxX-like family